jgi:hypothetical protein
MDNRQLSPFSPLCIILPEVATESTFTNALKLKVARVFKVDGPVQGVPVPSDTEILLSAPLKVAVLVTLGNRGDPDMKGEYINIWS